MANKQDRSRRGMLHTAEEEGMFFPSEMQGFEVLQALMTNSRSGLSTKVHKKRLKAFGANILRRELHLTPQQCVTEQFKNVVMFLFMLSAGITYVFDPHPAYIAAVGINIAVMCFNAALHFASSRALGIPRKYSSIKAAVTRGDKEFLTDSRTLVPGDIIRLENNMVVPADCRILTDSNLSVLETHLNEKSEPTAKDCDAISKRDEALLHPNMVYAGSIVTSGSCTAVVCFTGEETMTRKLAGADREASEPKIIKYVRRFSSVTATVAIAAAVVLLIIGVAAGADIANAFLCATGVAVTALSDTAVTLAYAALGFGLKKMAGNGTVIKNFNCISDMCGIDTVMCGMDAVTPPQEMTLDEVFVDNTFYPREAVYRSRSLELLTYMLLCSDLTADADDPKVFHGESWDVAAAHALCCGRNDLARMTENYFRMDIQRDAKGDPVRVLELIDGKSLMIQRGEPQTLLDECVGYSYKGQLFALSQLTRRKLQRAIREKGKTSDYITGVAVSFSKAQSLDDPDACKKKFFVGFITFKSFMSVDNASAVYRCRRAGVQTDVLTDEPYFSALSRGRDAGIISDEAEICTAEVMRSEDPGLFIANCPDYRLFLGLTDEEWYQMLLYRKDDGKKVAVCTDSLQQLQMMREADVSVVPESSPDVLRQSADAILSGGGFRAVSEMLYGVRRIFTGIHGMCEYLLVTFVMLALLCGAGMFMSQTPVRVQEMLVGGIVFNIMFALSSALSSDNRKLFLEKLPQYDVLPRISDFYLPISYGAVSAVAAAVVFAVTASHLCVLISMALSMLFYAANGVCRAGLFGRKAFYNRNLVISAFLCAACTAAVCLVPSAASAMEYTLPQALQLASAFGIPVAASLLFMLACLLVDKKRAEN